jgi:RNA polymerase sigma-70 factor (ECF subfamily)
VRFGRLKRVRFEMMPLDLSAGTPGTEPVTRRSDSIAEAETGARAFETAYNGAWLPVFRFALAWTNDWAAAEDLAQESFLRLWDRRARIDWTQPVLPWLLTTTKRNATDRFRRLRRGLAARGPISVSPMADAGIVWLDLRTDFAVLSPLERAALVLTALEDMPATEAGTILGVEANAVRSAASRGRRKLKERR